MRERGVYQEIVAGIFSKFDQRILRIEKAVVEKRSWIRALRIPIAVRQSGVSGPDRAPSGRMRFQRVLIQE